jgi:hypothetical protein
MDTKVRPRLSWRERTLVLKNFSVRFERKSRAKGILVKKLNDEINSSVDKKGRREDLRCSFCPPNRGENSSRKAKHGAKKPKYKDKRRKK